jgi:hypothetical protein
VLAWPTQQFSERIFVVVFKVPATLTQCGSASAIRIIAAAKVWRERSGSLAVSRAPQTEPERHTRIEIE